MIDVSDLHISYDNRPVLAGISFQVVTGDRLAILGANGSGKSTLAACLAGWRQPTVPESVRWQGRPWNDHSVSDRAGAVQLVGQIPLQHLSGRAFTVAEEVAFGPENLGMDVREILRRRDAALHACRLTHLADRNPFVLSGGEQQRLVIAAALALQPKVLILDEPFSNLDPDSRDHLIAVLGELDTAVAVVLLEASPDASLEIARRFMLLKNGKIALDGPAQSVVLHDETIDMVGLPAATKAFLELSISDNIPRHALPLTMTDAIAAIKEKTGAAAE